MYHSDAKKHDFFVFCIFLYRLFYFYVSCMDVIILYNLTCYKHFLCAYINFILIELVYNILLEGIY